MKSQNSVTETTSEACYVGHSQVRWRWLHPPVLGMLRAIPASNRGSSLPSGLNVGSRVACLPPSSGLRTVQFPRLPTDGCSRRVPRPPKPRACLQRAKTPSSATRRRDGSQAEPARYNLRVALHGPPPQVPCRMLQEADQRVATAAAACRHRGEPRAGSGSAPSR